MRASGAVQLEGGVGAWSSCTKVLNSCSWLGRLPLPSACLLAQPARSWPSLLWRCAGAQEGRAEIAQAHITLTRHGAYELTRPDHEENACHQVHKRLIPTVSVSDIFFHLSVARDTTKDIRDTHFHYKRVPHHSQKLCHIMSFSRTFQNIPQYSTSPEFLG